MVKVEDIAREAGVSIWQAYRVLSRYPQYMIGIESKGSKGRKEKVYSEEVLKVFATGRARKRREDFGRGRRRIEGYEALVEAIRERFFSYGEPNLLAAVEEVVKEKWCKEWEREFGSIEKMVKYIYNKRLMRNDRPRNPRSKEAKRVGYVGLAIQERWYEKWEMKWRRREVAWNVVPTNRYDYFKIFWELGLIGEGWGANQFLAIDDHTSDIFVYKEQEGYKGEQPKGVYVIDFVTGKLLDFAPGEVTTTKAGIMLVRLGMRYGLPRLVVAENSRALRSARFQKIVESLYPDEILQEYRDEGKNYWLRAIWGETNSPIAYNIPNIPRHPGKARIERWFRNILQHDAKYFPLTYTGGGKREVQLHLNSTPLTPPSDYTFENYFQSLKQYFENELSEKMHPMMFSGFEKQTGLQPTIKNVYEFLGGANGGTGIYPAKEKIAQLLYYLAEEEGMIIKRVVKAQPGRVRTVIDGEECWFVDESLNFLRGERVAIVVIPNQLASEFEKRLPGNRINYAALFHLVDDEPKFLNIVKNIKIDRPEIIEEAKAIVVATRRKYEEWTKFSEAREVRPRRNHFPGLPGNPQKSEFPIAANREPGEFNLKQVAALQPEGCGYQEEEKRKAISLAEEIESLRNL